MAPGSASSAGYGEHRTFSPQHLVQCVSNTQTRPAARGADGHRPGATEWPIFNWKF